MNRYLQPAGNAAFAVAAAFVLSGPAEAQNAPVTDEGNRHYDARIEHNRSFKALRPLARAQSLDSLAATVGELSLESDETTGAVRTLASHNGYLSPQASGEPMAIALDFVQKHLTSLGLTRRDIEGTEVTDSVFSAVTGATHIYLRQRHEGIPVYNAQLHINVNRDGRVISVNNSFLPDLAASVKGLTPRLGLPAAVREALRFAKIPVSAAPRIVKSAQGPLRATRVAHEGLSLVPIDGQLMLLPIREGDARLVWNFQIHTLDEEHSWDLTVDATSGQVWTRADWTVADSYNVFALPAESPIHVTPAAPADGRVTVTNPADSRASQFGWHDTNGAAGAEFNTTQGNNVHAYTDVNRDNAPDANSSPNGGTSRNFDFPVNFGANAEASANAAVTNLFYVSNMLHDIQYQYGFDEAAGNFQTNNYGRGGAGNDSLRAEAQDGAGTNNANFSTPPDGSRPRMQMFRWTRTTPTRDGDFDNGIIIHEYGHGISTRLVGGPSNSSCLTNRQQPGEGLSDWWTLAYTAKPTHTAFTRRPVGTYALGQSPTTGAGIRTQVYSVDPAVNTWRYSSINGMAVPHGVGSVWAQAAWEAYWELVGVHGFSANLHNATGSAGNQRMMLYVNEGLKNAACNPTFTQVRDGIIQAAADNHGGEDVCHLWRAFARFGLGTNAVSGGSSSTTPTDGFNLPASCQGQPTPTPTPGPTATPTPNPGGVVFEDNFELPNGWTTNPNGTDTATTGRWERGNPEDTSSGGTPKQLGTTTSGVNDLVTGRTRGASTGTNDMDNGTTSIRSPMITMPATGTLTLTFQQYLAHDANGSSADFLRVSIVSNGITTQVFQRVGSPTNVAAVWTPTTVNLSAFAGRSIQILITAADAGTPTLVEAAVDDVKITRQ
jgi:extracellular elastinolytic metalloproteinase